MEDIGSRIRNLPPLGQPRLNIEVIIAGEQIIEEQVVNAFGLRIQSHARIEIRGTALNNHHQGFRVRFAGTREAGEKQKRGDDST
jgi:hypothetical protein